ncbi:colanic acid/amylovoran biosynthesis glycosyltransferase [Lutibacter oceani]|uniref:Colanic acid/amylovoran biosynthesis glycosyltransferase n=1 Tax=Lutibacter oceani TaxID=1853311 RepID=A0A3D9RWM2_9FLAO|nr:glycosyltransferase family 4 protein [Lutibacter oceani]REE81984.1 colanic acid/amylovoran biosynthesis glycosyltransferase [Lutibacter oceani]
MKIGLVLPKVPAYSETFFLNKIKGLQKNGHTVIVFANSTEKSNYIASKVKIAPTLSGNIIRVAFVSFFNLMYSFLFHFKVSIRLYKLERQDGLSFSQSIKNIIANAHILSESLDWLHFGFGTMVFNREHVAQAIGAKMAVSFRGFDIGIYPLKNPNCYLKLWGKVDKIHVISNDIKELVLKNGFKGKAEIIKITPAIDTSFFKNNEQSFTSLKNNFITIARLHWKKGLVDTLEALSLLKKEGVSFHYTIIGEGDAYERLKFAVHQLDIINEVTFTGKISPELVKDKLNNADLYLQYSIQEGFCNAVLEAQAMGLLCVVSDAEGLSENVLDGETGWVVSSSNPKYLANKIKEVINLNEIEKNRIIIRAKERIKREFNLQKQQQEFVDFYKIKD